MNLLKKQIKYNYIKVAKNCNNLILDTVLDTLYDVIIPEDAEVVKVDEEKGAYRSNKIIVTNPRCITDDMVLKLYSIDTLSNKIIAQCLLTLIWKNRLEISKYIVNDRVNSNNAKEILDEFIKYAGEDNMKYDSVKEIINEIEKYR